MYVHVWMYMCWPSLGLILSLFLWLPWVRPSTFWSNKWTAVNTWLRLCGDRHHPKWHFVQCNQMHLMSLFSTSIPLSLCLSVALSKATELKDDRSPSDATVMTTFTILLIDKNDNAPKFNSSEYRVRITELAQVGFALPLFIQAEDKDEVSGSHPNILNDFLHFPPTIAKKIYKSGVPPFSFSLANISVQHIQLAVFLLSQHWPLLSSVKISNTSSRSCHLSLIILILRR